MGNLRASGHQPQTFKLPASCWGHWLNYNELWSGPEPSGAGVFRVARAARSGGCYPHRRPGRTGQGCPRDLPRPHSHCPRREPGRWHGTEQPGAVGAHRTCVSVAGGMQLLHTSERSDTTAAPAPAHAPRGKGTPVKGDAGDRGAAGTHNSTKGAAAVGSRWRGQELCGGFRGHRGGPCPKLGTSSLLSEVPAASTAAFSATSLAPNDPSLGQNSGPRMEGARNV